jgi:hypothetical protein
MLNPRALCLAFSLAAVLVPPGSAAAQPGAGWTALRQGGATVDVPRSIFPDETAAGDPPGRVFATPDGRARLHVFTIPNERGESPQKFLARVFPRNRTRLSYDRVTRNFFAVSQPNEARILYRRCNFVRDAIHCIDLQYPRSEKRAFDGIVTRISLSLRPR